MTDACAPIRIPVRSSVFGARQVKVDQHREALRIPQPLAVIVYGGQAAEWSRVDVDTESGCSNMTSDHGTGESIEYDLDRVSLLDIAEIIFGKVRLNPYVVCSDESHQGCARLREVAAINADIGNDAIVGCSYGGT